MDYMNSTHVPSQVCSSCILVLITFIVTYIDSPARNIYRLKSLPISY